MKTKTIVLLLGIALTISLVGNIWQSRQQKSTQVSDDSAGKLSFETAQGKRAPEFSLESLDGKTVKLSDFREKVVVLFFNEGAMCYPACWEQVAALATDERLNTEDVKTFSIVVDAKADWQKIISEVPQLAKAQILFDSARKASLAYDVLSLPSSMHPGLFPGHTYFVIDKEGMIRWAFDDANMAIWNDKIFEEVEKLLPR